MPKNLVIVESPAKARTIERFLGSDYAVVASLGHVRDLPTSAMGVSVDDGFTPEYVIPPGKKKVVQELKRAAKGASMVYLATDPDREGEAISWHIMEALGLKARSVRRVVFHQITPEAIREAFQHPRDIDLSLVNAQQARRILDRLVGYRLSPLLWSKLRWPGLSAGRVQSVALRLIAERERAILAFVPQEYWSIDTQLQRQQGTAGEGPFGAALYGVQGHKGRLAIHSGEKARELVEELKGAAYRVADVQRQERRQRPAAPFTTSTLQQEAWRKLRFDAQRTMRVAQDLYEGLPIAGEGEVGLITYMRTDSTTVAPQAVHEARAYIESRFGQEYLPPRPRVYTTRTKGAQEAHEAIRPTSLAREPRQMASALSRDQLRLYELIWMRMVASQMADALLDSTSVDIQATPARGKVVYVFRATGSRLKFPGFRALYLEGRDDDDRQDGSSLPDLAPGNPLACLSLDPGQHFTQPPPRYTEATLVKTLEEEGIGRPSTYAPTIATLLAREYVSREGGRLQPTPLGTAVNGLLTEQFPDLIEVGFTARMEEELDEVARGEREWAPLLQEFYGPFDAAVAQAQANHQRVHVDAGQQCPLCGKPMVIKRGRFGPFLSCSDYPECRHSQPIRKSMGVACPEDGGDLVARKSKSGKRRTFYGCSNFPKCTFTIGQRPLPQPCPQCSKLLVASGRDRARCTACGFTGSRSEAESEVEAAVEVAV